MGNDDLLREKVRQGINTGKLPDRAPDHVWGGPGTGADCAICGASILHGDTELEVEFTGAERPAPENLLVHLRCFSILEVERQKISISSESPVPRS